MVSARALFLSPRRKRGRHFLMAGRMSADKAGGGALRGWVAPPPLNRGVVHLKYLNSDGHKATASPASAGEAGAPEIEITPAMIAAGVCALPFLSSSEIGSLTEETLVSRVFLAMDKARGRGHLSPPERNEKL
jgi:hypothetical protein